MNFLFCRKFTTFDTKQGDGAVRFGTEKDEELDIISWAECKTLASATYDTLAVSVWTLPECKSIVSANFYFSSFLGEFSVLMIKTA